MEYTKESFEEVLQEAYDALEAEDIKELLAEARTFLRESHFENGFITSICISVINKRNISFKQWKAISAYVAECKREEQQKNNKTF